MPECIYVDLLRAWTWTCFFCCHVPCASSGAHCIGSAHVNVCMSDVPECMLRKDRTFPSVWGYLYGSLCPDCSLKCQETKYRVGKVILVLGQSKNFGRLCLGNKMIGLKSCRIWFAVGNWPTSPVSVIQSTLSCSYRLLWTQTWWSMNEVLF